MAGELGGGHPGVFGGLHLNQKSGRVLAGLSKREVNMEKREHRGRSQAALLLTVDPHPPAPQDPARSKVERLSEGLLRWVVSNHPRDSAHLSL